MIKILHSVKKEDTEYDKSDSDSGISEVHLGF